jgi:dimethylaniline monooxygenase (N-oxide forming)
MLEQNLRPTVFDANAKLGGVWRSTVGNTWNNMQTNLSKYSCCFSDFPVRNPSNSLFPYAHEMCEYLEQYADHFEVTPHIQVNSVVTYLTQLEDERWLVKWKNTITCETYEQIFDFVVVASGMYTTPSFPVIDGQLDFKGQVIHSKDYNSIKCMDLEDKTVVVVGAAYSGSEISSDLTATGARVINLFSQPYWVFKKVCSFDPTNLELKLPIDFGLFSRQASHSIPNFESIEEDRIFKNRFYDAVLKEQNQLTQRDLHIDPNCPEALNMAISNDYIDLVKQNRIVPKKGKIKKFYKHGVELVDGSVLQADVVVWCTGYSVDLGFVESKILKQLEYEANDRLQPLILYRATFRPELKHIAFVGLLKAPLYTVDELQGRWASLVFSGKLRLPSESATSKYLDETRSIRGRKLKPQALNQNFTRYSDEMAKEIGVLPDLEEIKRENPELYRMMWHGLPVSAQYRYNDNKELAIQITKEAFEVRESFLNSEKNSQLVSF